MRNQWSRGNLGSIPTLQAAIPEFAVPDELKGSNTAHPQNWCPEACQAAVDPPAEVPGHVPGHSFTSFNCVIHWAVFSPDILSAGPVLESER